MTLGNKNSETMIGKSKLEIQNTLIELRFSAKKYIRK
jgi:hypothetical protein